MERPGESNRAFPFRRDVGRAVSLLEPPGHRSFQTTQQYIDLAGVVFRDEASR
jgi:hypothetical protein